MIRAWLARRRRRAFFGSMVAPGALAFDVGAARGAKVELLLAAQARVVAIEPLPEAAAALRKRFGKAITVVEAAVDARSGVAELLVSDTFPELSTLSAGSAERVDARIGQVNRRAVQVRTVTLAELIAEHGPPQFCKIDVEGLEDRVVAGLDRPIGHVMFECLAFDRAPADRAAERLQSLGAYQFQLTYDEAEGFALPAAGPWAAVAAEIGRARAPGMDVHARIGHFPPR